MLQKNYYIEEKLHFFCLGICIIKIMILNITYTEDVFENLCESKYHSKKVFEKIFAIFYFEQ